MNMRRDGSKPCLAAGAVSSGGWPVLPQRPPYQVTKTGADGETDTSDSQGRARAMRGRGLWDAGTAAARPPAPTLWSQQQRFEVFRLECNTVRPHEALGDETPASVYTRSPRPYPSTPPPLEYPAHYEVRLASANGGIRWQSRWVNGSHVLAGEYVGLVEIDDAEWDLYFGSVKLGRFHERLLRVEDALGRLARRRVPV